MGQGSTLENFEFRLPPGRHIPPKTGGLSLVVKIAIGVFVGLSLFALATCTMMIIGAKAVADEQARRQQAAIEELRRISNDPDPLGIRREAQRRARADAAAKAAAKALQPGERCIQGKRFRRVENGWVQINRPC